MPLSMRRRRGSSTRREPTTTSTRRSAIAPKTHRQALRMVPLEGEQVTCRLGAIEASGCQAVDTATRPLRYARGIRRAAEPGARVLLAEAVIPPGNEFSFGKLLDLEMLTLPGAIERTEEARVPALCSAAHVLVLRPAKENSMPRQRSLVTVIRDLVQQEVRSAIQSLFSTVSPSKPATNGRR